MHWLKSRLRRLQVAGRSKFTEEEKGAALRALTLNDGNVKKTAREIGMNASTLKSWRNEWARHGVPEGVMVVAQQEAEQFITDAIRARDTALSKWEAKVENDEVAARDLMTGVGVLTDKINLAKGLDRKNSDKPALDHEQLRAIARGVVEGAVSTALKRQEEIIDAEYEEVEPAMINRGTS